MLLWIGRVEGRSGLLRKLVEHVERMDEGKGAF
jgi:hypothetical protein